MTSPGDGQDGGTGPKPPYPPSKGSADLMHLLASRAAGSYGRNHRYYARWCAARATVLRVR